MPKPEEYTRIEQILDNSAYSGYKQSLSDPAAMQKRIHDLQIELARLKTLPESKSDYTHHNGTSLLMLAARQNAAFAIGPLLDFKADMNEHTRDNVTAIMLAVRHGNIETTKMLFDSGAKVDDLFKKVFPQKITPHNMRVVETTKGTSLASPDSYVSAFDRILLKGNLMMLLLLKDKFTQELAPLKKEEVKANPLVEKLALIDERINRVFREQGPEQKGVKSPSMDKVMESVQLTLIHNHKILWENIKSHWMSVEFQWRSPLSLRSLQLPLLIQKRRLKKRLSLKYK